MRDPIERMVNFVLAQKEQAALEHARSVWSRRVPALVPRVREVLTVFHAALEGPDGTAASLLLDPQRKRSLLVIAFERRRCEDHDGILRMHPERPAMEVGASAVFRCETDGIVYGFRYPFHEARQDVRPERFVDLGEPSAVEANRLAHAAAEFLEWASVGAGCGSRKMRFWAPPASLPVPQQPIQLGLVAA